jgi:predicted secreted protein
MEKHLSHSKEENIMEIGSGILLNSHWDNKMTINGEVGWFIEEYNGSTGYSWKCRSDNSGVYKMVEQIILYPSTEAVGVSGMFIWKVKGIRAGKGSIFFELFPPGAKSPSEATEITITVE